MAVLNFMYIISNFYCNDANYNCQKCNNHNNAYRIFRLMDSLWDSCVGLILDEKDLAIDSGLPMEAYKSSSVAFGLFSRKAETSDSSSMIQRFFSLELQGRSFLTS